MKYKQNEIINNKNNNEINLKKVEGEKFKNENGINQLKIDLKNKNFSLKKNKNKNFFKSDDKNNKINKDYNLKKENCTSFSKDHLIHESDNNINKIISENESTQSKIENLNSNQYLNNKIRNNYSEKEKNNFKNNNECFNQDLTVSKDEFKDEKKMENKEKNKNDNLNKIIKKKESKSEEDFSTISEEMNKNNRENVRKEKTKRKCTEKKYNIFQNEEENLERIQNNEKTKAPMHIKEKKNISNSENFIIEEEENGIKSQNYFKSKIMQGKDQISSRKIEDIYSKKNIKEEFYPNYNRETTFISQKNNLNVDKKKNAIKNQNFKEENKIYENNYDSKDNYIFEEKNIYSEKISNSNNFSEKNINKNKNFLDEEKDNENYFERKNEYIYKNNHKLQNGNLENNENIENFELLNGEGNKIKISQLKKNKDKNNYENSKDLKNKNLENQGKFSSKEIQVKNNYQTIQNDQIYEKNFNKKEKFLHEINDSDDCESSISVEVSKEKYYSSNKRKSNSHNNVYDKFKEEEKTFSRKFISEANKGLNRKTETEVSNTINLKREYSMAGNKHPTEEIYKYKTKSFQKNFVQDEKVKENQDFDIGYSLIKNFQNPDLLKLHTKNYGKYDSKNFDLNEELIDKSDRSFNKKQLNNASEKSNNQELNDCKNIFYENNFKKQNKRPNCFEKKKSDNFLNEMSENNDYYFKKPKSKDNKSVNLEKLNSKNNYVSYHDSKNINLKNGKNKMEIINLNNDNNIKENSDKINSGYNKIQLYANYAPKNHYFETISNNKKETLDPKSKKKFFEKIEKSEKKINENSGNNLIFQSNVDSPVKIIDVLDENFGEEEGINFVNQIEKSFSVEKLIDKEFFNKNNGFLENNNLNINNKHSDFISTKKAYHVKNNFSTPNISLENENLEFLNSKQKEMLKNMDNFAHEKFLQNQISQNQLEKSKKFNSELKKRYSISEVSQKNIVNMVFLV